MSVLTRLNHSAARRHLHDVKAQGDPSGTMSIRRSVMRMMDRRWSTVNRSVQQAVSAADMLGLRTQTSTATAFGLMSFMNPSSNIPNAGKIRMFQRWFDDQLAQLILEQNAAFIRPALLNTYNKAMLRATRLAKLDAVPAKTLAEVTANIDTLQQFFVIELQGIMEAVSQRGVRAATEGMLQRLRPAPVTRAIKQGVQQVGVNRTRALVQTLIIRAHSEGTLDTFEAAGIKMVGLLPESFRRDTGLTDARRKSRARARAPEPMVEILTAGDNDVCEECEDLSNAGPYSIDDARGLIPAHPNCRCAFVPVEDARFAPVETEDD